MSLYYSNLLALIILFYYLILVRDVIENEDNKVDPNFFDQLSDNLSNVKIESSPTKNSQLETPDVSMDISKSSKMNNLNF